MEALSYQQAEDHLTEAVFVICHHFEEPDAHRFRPRRTHHGRLYLNGFFVGSRFNDQLDKPAWSSIRRNRRPDSDLDLLIIEESDLPRSAVGTVSAGALRGVVSLRRLSFGFLKRSKNGRPVTDAFISTVLVEGKPLCAPVGGQLAFFCSSFNRSAIHNLITDCLVTPSRLA